MSTNRANVAAPPVAPAASKAAEQPLSHAGLAVQQDRKGWFNLTFLVLVLGFILMGILNFSVKLFLMGDDANYILDGYNFVYRHTYPQQSSLYGMVLGVIELFTSTNVVLLKCCSFLFALVGFITLYRIGYKRIDARIFYPMLIYCVISSNLQYYSSSNLSEAFYMMLQYLYTGYVFIFMDRLATGANMRKHWLILGFMGLLLSLGKNVAIVGPLAVVVYFLAYKQWRHALYALGVFLLFKVPYEVMLRFVYQRNTGVGQLDQVLNKNLYHPEQGRETLAGFGIRLVKNAQIYLGQITLKELGIVTSGWVTFIATLVIAGILAAAVFFARKCNRYVFFISLYTGIMAVVTFLALQPAVAQDRIIIILVPFLILLLFYGGLQLAGRINSKYPAVNTTVFYGILAVSGFVNLKVASATVSNNLPVLQENLGGDLYYGYTPDWINYLEMGSWVSEHIPGEQVVAARKPNSLSVYSKGRDFYGIYNSPDNLDADQLLAKLKEQKINYMILASLRGDPAVANPKNIITTLHRYCAKIVQKYPNALKVVHTIGKDEPCYLVKINYP